MKDYLMYLRKSRADRDFEDEPVMQTLRRHKVRLDEYCLAHDIIIPEDNILYEVAGADSIASRPEMMRLLSLVETGKYEAVLCVDMDRLSRGSGADQALVMNTFKFSNTKIVTPQKIYDFTNEADEQFAELGLFMAKNEYRQIKKRLRQGKVDATKEGKYATANPPYGYKTYKLQKQKGFSLEIVEEEANVVRQMFQMYTEADMGSGKIAAWLNDHGYRTRNGNLWSASHVSVILRNPTYIGKVRYAHRVNVFVMRNGEMVKTERNNDENQLICDGLHEPIISEDVFKKAEAVRSTHHIPHVRKACEMRNPFLGILVCGRCGKGMRLRSADHLGRAVFCETPGCPTKGSYLKYIEEDTFKWMDEYLEEIESEKFVPDKETLRRLERSLYKTMKLLSAETNKQKRIYQLLEDGVYSVSEYQDRMKQNKERISEIEKRLSNEEQEYDLFRKRELQRSVITPTIKTVAEKYRTLPTAKEKNQLLKGIFAKIVYTKDTGGKGHGKEYHLEFYPKSAK